MDSECKMFFASVAKWKLRTVMKTRRFHTEIEMFQLFKSHVLPPLEYRTPAIYHASATILNYIDSVQRMFLKDMNISPEDALMDKSFNLAPLGMRRDIAMLGVIHRAVLKKGPKQLHKWFFTVNPGAKPSTRSDNSRSRQRQVFNYMDGTQNELLRRSAFGLTAVYNSLPEKTILLNTVKSFQGALQDAAKRLIENGTPNWAFMYNPSYKYNMLTKGYM